MLSTILIVVLILLLIGALPTWPYSASWGYAPGGLLGTVLLVVLILAAMGTIHVSTKTCPFVGSAASKSVRHERSLVPHRGSPAERTDLRQYLRN